MAEVTPGASLLDTKADKLFKVNLGTTQNSIDKVLSLTKSDTGWVNNFTGGSSIVINSDRLILNAKADHAFLCGKKGITITSPSSIHIDSDDDVYIASQTEVYLGLPNKGQTYQEVPAPTTKASATPDVDYEPLVLGLKLANLLEDLIVIMRDAVIRTPAGDGHMSVEMMYNLECLQARLPELISTAVFVDGRSHGKVDDPPAMPDTTILQTNDTAGGAGSTVSGNTQSTTGTTQQNTQSAINNITNPLGNLQQPANQVPLMLQTVSSGNNPDGPVQ